MFDRNRVGWMSRQIFGEAGIAFITYFQIDGVKLVVRLLPAFAHEGKPLSREAEDVAFVVEPDGLLLEGEPCDGEVGDVDFLAVIFDTEVGKALQSRLTCRQETQGCTVCFLQSADQRGGFGRSAIVADVKCSRWRVSVLRRALPAGGSI